MKLSNPKTAEYQIVRTSLLPGLLKTIRENKSHSLPLKVFEASDVVFKDDRAERKTRNERHYAAAFCGRTSGFEEVHGLLDRVMLMLRTSFLTREEGVAGANKSIDFEVRDPNDKVLLDGQRERQGDYVLTANTPGEYAFCFENDMSTLTEKLVDFDIMVEKVPRLEAPARQQQLSEQTSALEESVFRLNGMLMNIKRTQK